MPQGEGFQGFPPGMTQTVPAPQQRQGPFRNIPTLMPGMNPDDIPHWGKSVQFIQQPMSMGDALQGRQRQVIANSQNPHFAALLAALRGGQR